MKPVPKGPPNEVIDWYARDLLIPSWFWKLLPILGAAAFIMGYLLGRTGVQFT